MASYANCRWFISSYFLWYRMSSAYQAGKTAVAEFLNLVFVISQYNQRNYKLFNESTRMYTIWLTKEDETWMVEVIKCMKSNKNSYITLKPLNYFSHCEMIDIRTVVLSWKLVSAGSQWFLSRVSRYVWNYVWRLGKENISNLWVSDPNFLRS